MIRFDAPKAMATRKIVLRFEMFFFVCHKTKPQESPLINALIYCKLSNNYIVALTLSHTNVG